MDYLSIAYVFQFENRDWLRGKNIHLTIMDYFEYIYNKDALPYKKPEQPARMNRTVEDELEFGNEIPKKRIEEMEKLRQSYSTKLAKWELDSITSLSYRKTLIKKIIEKLNEKHIILSKSRNGENSMSNNFTDLYESYEKKEISSWLYLWESANLKYESLENLILFQKYLYGCLSEKAILDEAENRKKIAKSATRDMIELTRYYNSINTYEDGGGGQEWSDPSRFW